MEEMCLAVVFPGRMLFDLEFYGSTLAAHLFERTDLTTVSTELRKSKPTNPKQKQGLQTRITHLVETTGTTTVSTELRDQRHLRVKAGIN